VVAYPAIDNTETVTNDWTLYSHPNIQTIWLNQESCPPWLGGDTANHHQGPAVEA